MRRTFESDHSSSSYEFYTPRSLSDAEKKAVKRLSGETAKGKHLKVHLWGEGEMAYSKEKQLLAKYYDIEVSESYDWWTDHFFFDLGIAALGHHVGADVAEEDDVVTVQTLQFPYVIAAPRLQGLNGIETHFHQQRDEFPDIAVAVEHERDALSPAPLPDALVARSQLFPVHLR